MEFHALCKVYVHFDFIGAILTLDPYGVYLDLGQGAYIKLDKRDHYMTASCDSGA